MTDLPPITDIQRYHYQPGDALIVYLDGRPDMTQADRIKQAIRGTLAIPDLPILIFANGSRLDIVNMEQSCQSEYASNAEHSTTATQPTHNAAHNANPQQQPNETSAPTPPHAATDTNTSNY